MSKKRSNSDNDPLRVIKKREPEPIPFDRFENWLGRRKRRILLMPIILGALFGILMFDVKISEGNDDAMYIEAAYKYARDFTGYYYTANAPMYPMLLGVVTMFSGINLLLFKVINLLLFLLHLALMYYAFRRRIPWSVLYPVLLFSAFNSYLLYYSSQTYTEMLFLVLQALFFVVFFYWYEKIQVSRPIEERTKAPRKRVYNNNTTEPNLSVVADDPEPVAKKSWFSLLELKAGLSIGFALFLMTFCKNIAIGMLGALILFFLLEKNYRSLLYTAAGYLVVRVSFELLKATVWGASNQYGSQGAILLQKDAYNSAAGQETIGGFVTRFFENFNLYISKRFFQILGFRNPDSTEVYTFISVCMFFLLLWAMYLIFRNRRLAAESGYVEPTQQKLHPATAQKLAEATNTLRQPASSYLLIVFLYVVTMLGLTFLVLQTRWDQPRLIMVYTPLLLMVIWYAFYAYFHHRGNTGLYLYFFLVVFMLGSSLLTTTKKSIRQFPVLKKNIAGDAYYGYTPDWENYLRLSAWCADSLPPNSLVACRKAPMSFVYGKGKEFFPVYTVVAIDTVTNLSNADSVLTYFKQNNVTHVLLASLRRNPNKPDGYIINTLHRMLEPISRKYPQKLKLVKTVGSSEAAHLYEVRY